MADRLRIAPRHRRILEALLREHLPGIEAWAYGSRVNGRGHDGSDLDLVLRTPDLQRLAADQLAGFEDAVRESTIPFLVEVHDWDCLPERFHREIERDYVVMSESPAPGTDWVGTRSGDSDRGTPPMDFAAAKRDSGRQAAQMTGGHEDLHRDTIVAALAANDRVERALFFNSRVAGTEGMSPDPNIALLGSRLTVLDRARLSVAVDKIPMAQSVDLVLYDSIQDRTLRERIRREGVEWYVRSDHDGTICDTCRATSTWPISRFEELLGEPVRNGIYKSKDHHGHGVKVVNMGEIFAYPRLHAVPMRRVRLSESEIERFSVVKGDLLFARRSLVAEGAGKCCVVLDVDEPTTFESSIIRARPDATTSDPLYLYYYFCSPSGLHRLDTIRRQVAVAGITGKDLSKLEIPVPPLTEQRSIAQILGTLDDKIELNRRMNATLEEMARALFKSWFVDFDPVRAKIEGRDTGLPKDVADLFPDRLVGSELGEIPEGWTVRTLGDLCHKPQYGYTASAKKLPVGPRFLRITDVNKESWITWCRVPFCEATDDEFLKYHLKKGELLIARMADPGHGILVEEDVKAVFASYLIRFKPIDSGHARLLQYWLKSDAYWQLVRGQSAGTTRVSLNAKVLSLFSLVMPPDTVASAFAASIDPLRERLVNSATEMQVLATIRDTLLPKLVSGELRVTGLETASEPSGCPESVGAHEA